MNGDVSLRASAMPAPRVSANSFLGIIMLIILCCPCKMGAVLTLVERADWSYELYVRQAPEAWHGELPAKDFPTIYFDKCDTTHNLIYKLQQYIWKYGTTAKTTKARECSRRNKLRSGRQA